MRAYPFVFCRRASELAFNECRTMEVPSKLPLMSKPTNQDRTKCKQALKPLHSAGRVFAKSIPNPAFKIAQEGSAQGGWADHIPICFKCIYIYVYIYIYICMRIYRKTHTHAAQEIYHDTMQHATLRYNTTMPYNALHYLYHALGCWHNTVECNTRQHCNTIQHMLACDTHTHPHTHIALS